MPRNTTDYKVYRGENGKIVSEQTAKIELENDEDVSKALIEVRQNIEGYTRQKENIEKILERLYKEEVALLSFFEKDKAGKVIQ